jgi:uncharacterized membrane protein
MDFINTYMSYICHQIPERSFIIQGSVIPLCARCCGIYIGYSFSFLLIIFIIKISSHNISRSLTLVALFLLIIGEIYFEKLHLIILMNAGRFVIGVIIGVCMSLLVLPVYMKIRYYKVMTVILVSITSLILLTLICDESTSGYSKGITYYVVYLALTNGLFLLYYSMIIGVITIILKRIDVPCIDYIIDKQLN